MSRTLFPSNSLCYAQFSPIIERMTILERTIKPLLDKALEKGNHLLILGARKTGKTALVKTFPCHLRLHFMHTPHRQRR